ncbi:MAG: Nif3-like dinuclear metal center hexameric protein [Gemmatimonadetes bacterium]|nr:Nif3-like dinuclear metal center hexameric protein [Gemmatimonadota bacterium]
MTVLLNDLAAHVDKLLHVRDTPDYPNAINGVQVAHSGPITRLATAVDASELAIRRAVASGANLLLVHHGLFWSGLQPIAGHQYERIRLLFDHDVALYSVHLPLDAHGEFGNSRLLAAELSLPVTDGFAHYQGVACGVQGSSDTPTRELVARVARFSATHGGNAVASAFDADRQTRRWAICSGAGAGGATLDEATALGIDTLIVGEGPHWTAVDAPERGLVIIYAGHYATETLGVTALGEHLSTKFDLPHQFIAAPTGL